MWYYTIAKCAQKRASKSLKKCLFIHSLNQFEVRTYTYTHFSRMHAGVKLAHILLAISKRNTFYMTRFFAVTTYLLVYYYVSKRIKSIHTTQYNGHRHFHTSHTKCKHAECTWSFTLVCRQARSPETLMVGQRFSISFWT